MRLTGRINILPRELWDGFWGHFWPSSLCFSHDIVTTEFWFASCLHAWRLVSISISSFRHIQGTVWSSGTCKPVRVLLCIFYFKQCQPRMCVHRAQNLTVLKHSFNSLNSIKCFHFPNRSSYSIGKLFWIFPYHFQLDNYANLHTAHNSYRFIW